MTIEMSSLLIVLNDYLGTCFVVIINNVHEESRSRSSVIVHPHNKQEEQMSQSHKKFCQITGMHMHAALMALTHSHHATATAILLLQRRCAQVYEGSSAALKSIKAKGGEGKHISIR
jgi:hypothetical protein